MMRSTMTKATVAAVLTLGLLAGCGRQQKPGADTVPADPTVVRTTDGPVKGSVTGQVRHFDGIPYAAPPVGELRWKQPQPVAKWTDVRPATKQGPACAQADESGEGLLKGTSEDCLYLNVTAPASTSGTLEPVVVWLHGGGYSSGSGNDYDSDRMVAGGNVVTVAVNSRLGVFGFFGHPDLPDSGSYGLADQQAALRWVRDNAKAFGGDPGKVLLAGESSGGYSVCAQLVAPGSRDLFQAAAIQSGTCHNVWPHDTFAPGDGESKLMWSLKEIQDRGRTAGKPYKCETAECLRKVKTADLLKLNGPFHNPSYGTSFLPQDPGQAIRRGEFAHVPVLQGSNKDEHRLFAVIFDLPDRRDPKAYEAQLETTFGKSRAAAILREYPLTNYATTRLAFAAVAGDFATICPTVTSDRDFAKYTKTYAYEFADPKPPGAEFFPRNYDNGAYHGSELVYLFDMKDSWSALDEPQRALAARMITAWTSLARTGDPGWPTFDGKTAKQFRPGADGTVDLVAEHHCGFWS